MNYNLIGLLLAILSTFFYGIMDLNIKWVSYVYKMNHSILYFQSTIVMFVLLTIIGLCVRKKKLFSFKASHPILIIRGAISFINFYFAFYILGVLPFDIYYSVVFLAPSFASIVAIFLLKEKLNIFKTVALLMGLLGILIITNPFSTTFNTAFIFPILLTVILAMSFALTGIITRKYLKDENPFSVACYINLVSLALAFICSSIDTSIKDTLTIDYNVVLFIVLIAIFCVIGMLLFIIAYQMAPVQLVAPAEYCMMIWGLLFGYLFFLDTPAISTLIGAVIIVMSNFITGLGAKNTKNLT